MEQNPYPEERKKREEGRQARNPNRNQEEAANHEGTKAVTSKNWEPGSAQELFGEKIKHPATPIQLRNNQINAGYQPHYSSYRAAEVASTGMRMDVHPHPWPAGSHSFVGM